MAIGKVELKRFEDDELIVYVSDYETGSATSLGAVSVEDGLAHALVWLGYDVLWAE